jgi:hypothetical protein
MMDCIVVNIHTQTLCLYLKDKLIKKYPISTSIRGVGSKENSEKTPLGSLIGAVYGFFDAGIGCAVFAVLYNKFAK